MCFRSQAGSPAACSRIMWSYCEPRKTDCQGSETCAGTAKRPSCSVSDRTGSVHDEQRPCSISTSNRSESPMRLPWVDEYFVARPRWPVERAPFSCTSVNSRGPFLSLRVTGQTGWAARSSRGAPTTVFGRAECRFHRAVARQSCVSCRQGPRLLLNSHSLTAM